MKKRLSLAFVFMALTTMMTAQIKKNVNTDPYPYGNPVIRHMYTADAAPHVMPDGKVWMITSVDHEDGGGYATMHCYHAFSSLDMANWTDHGEIFNVEDLRPKDAPKSDKWAVWAPDFIFKDGKYYLYIPVRIQHGEESEEGKRKVTAYIAVAESESLTKHFKVLSHHIEGASGIDPAVFRDTDGKIYLYWGSHMAAQLKDNMCQFVSKPVRLDVGTDRFMEAIWMDKHNGKYYVSYHTKYDNKVNPANPGDPNRKPSELAYSVGESPMGPFVYKGVLNYELGVGVTDGPKMPNRNFVPWRLTQSNHGGIVEFHGQKYLFYHTSALSSWRQDRFKGPGTWTQRSVCIDKLNFDKNGDIIPVKQTVKGVPAVSVNQPYEINLNLDGKKIGIGSMLMAKSVDLGSGYYYFSADVSQISHPMAVEIRLDSENGKLLGTLVIDKDGHHSTSLIDANGKHKVYLKAVGGEAILSKCRFLAGCPQMSGKSTKPIVWIYTDMSDKTIPGNNKEGTLNDPDDISAMAGYLLLANCFDTRSIVVASTHRSGHKKSGNQADWAQSYFGKAYKHDIANLSKVYPDYPQTIPFVESCIKRSAEHFNYKKDYSKVINDYPSVKSLIELLNTESETVNVLCWGSLTEPAILVNACLNSGKSHLLKKVRFIGHWTDSSLHQGSAEHPENVANCREDAAACSYMKAMAAKGTVCYYECGAIGQAGIVDGSPKGKDYYNQFKKSQLGDIYSTGKFAFNTVDDSDCATYYVLLGKYGVCLTDIASNGTNSPNVEKRNEQTFRHHSKQMRDELLKRSNIAAGNI